MRGNKGIVFSIDALFAVGLLVVAGSAMFLAFPSMESSSHSYEAVSMQAHDSAIVNFYLGKVHLEAMGADGNRFVGCVDYFNYKPQSDAAPIKYNVCRRIK